MIWNNDLRQWEYDLSDPKEEDLYFQDWLGSREYAIDLLKKSKGWKQCSDEVYTYYATVVNGSRLMYRKATMRADGRKMYRMNDELARLLQFEDMQSMMCSLPTIQYWRGWVSPERLTTALNRYINKIKSL